MAFITTFQDFFFKQLPLMFKRDDSYKDINGDGLLERYLRVFGLEIDNEVIPYAEEYMEIMDVMTTDEKFLPLISYGLGNPPNLLYDPALYRKLLRYILAYYKIKGIKESYELFFALLGYTVTVVEYPEQDVRFDSGYLMDDGNLMDEHCVTCSDYELFLMLTGAHCDPTAVILLDEALLALIELIISFTEPINAVLLHITNMVEACEDIDGCISENISISVTETIAMDSGYIMDDAIELDTTTKIFEQELDLECTGNSIAILATEDLDALTQEQNDNSPILV